MKHVTWQAWVSLKPLLQVMWWHNSPSAAHSAVKYKYSSNLVEIQRQSDARSNCLSNCSELSQRNAPYVSNSQTVILLFLRIVYWIHTFICSSCQWTSWVFQQPQGHTTSELGKPLKNLHSSRCLLAKSYFQHFTTFYSIVFSSLKQNLKHTCCSFKSTIILVSKNCNGIVLFDKILKNYTC